MTLQFIDFEVFKYNWVCVIADSTTQKEVVIVDDPDELRSYYNHHKDDIFVGYNIRDYDSYIFKAILSGFDPYEMNDFIINKGYKGYQFSDSLRQYPLITYDIIQLNTSLKQLEAFQGHSIYESDVDFRLDRPLTQAEIDETIEYCRNDVQETINLFVANKSDFEAQLELVTEFELPVSYMGKTQSQLTAAILGAQRRDFDDEFNLNFPPYLNRIKKYKFLVDWYKVKKNRDYSKSLKIEVAGVPHVYAWGGLHGAIPKYTGSGYYLHIDVNSYYPSLMISHDYFSRTVPESGKERFRMIYSENLRLKSIPEMKRKRKAYKLVCNKTYGCYKDKYNALYDPLMSNNICVTGQLALTLLIEMLEPYVQLIQSNTDGLIVKLPDLDADEIVDDIAYEWECMTGVKLGFDPIITRIYQKDVNNYLFVNEFGEVEAKGGYVKDLNPFDNDLPIVNRALREYMISGTPIETTVNSATELIDFQKVVKLSSKYAQVEHNGKVYTNKCYRVFASKDTADGTIYKCRDGKRDKFANTPVKCFLNNGDIQGAPVPDKLDRAYYIELAQERLRQFGG